MSTTKPRAAKAQTKDEMIIALLGKVNAQKLEIEKAEKPSWETNSAFRFNADAAHSVINIQTVTDVRKLREILAFLIERETAFNEAGKRLGLDEDNFTWLGFTVKEWEADLLTRVNIIQIQAKRKKLAELEAQLNSLVSKEKREELQLQAIAALLNS